MTPRASYGLVLLAFGILWLSACAPVVLPARLYTGDGQILQAHFSFSNDGQGEVWGQLLDGESFRGEYFTIMNRNFSSTWLNTPWGPISGLSVSEAGPQVTHITAAGDHGTQMKCISFPRGEHGVGGCRDSHNREYQLYY